MLGLVGNEVKTRRNDFKNSRGILESTWEKDKRNGRVSAVGWNGVVEGSFNAKTWARLYFEIAACADTWRGNRFVAVETLGNIELDRAEASLEYHW